jgi:hypothetical protein
MTGQVASAIDGLVRVSEFVPAMAKEAARVLRALSAQLV